jgi:hypothetical protein
MLFLLATAAAAGAQQNATAEVPTPAPTALAAANVTELPTPAPTNVTEVPTPSPTPAPTFSVVNDTASPTPAPSAQNATLEPSTAAPTPSPTPLPTAAPTPAPVPKVDCVLSDWEIVVECPPCGEYGSQTSIREIIRSGSGGGVPCPPLSQLESVVDCVYEECDGGDDGSGQGSVDDGAGGTGDSSSPQTVWPIALTLGLGFFGVVALYMYYRGQRLEEEHHMTDDSELQRDFELRRFDEVAQRARGFVPRGDDEDDPTSGASFGPRQSTFGGLPLRSPQTSYQQV